MFLDNIKSNLEKYLRGSIHESDLNNILSYINNRDIESALDLLKVINKKEFSKSQEERVPNFYLASKCQEDLSNYYDNTFYPANNDNEEDDDNDNNNNNYYDDYLWAGTM
jgi:hypothetical protein